MTAQIQPARRISERLRECALELAQIAEIGPRELNELKLTKMAVRLLQAADQVALGERPWWIDGAPPESPSTVGEKP